MRILFTPAGDTDPVRGFHDGAILHILRHYPADKVILFLTKDMEEKEDEMHCYTRGIASVAPDVTVEILRSGITEPQKYEKLTAIQDAFASAYDAHPEAEWLLNVSSGTPQIKTVMALLALDYPRTKAIQVPSPERKSNRGNHPCRTADELVEMLDCNEDAEPGAVNRCEEPPLLLLKRHGLLRQVTSLVRNYEYAGALQIVSQNKNCFSPISEKLLQHAALRRDLMWKEANKVIAQYEGKPLIEGAGDFSEYFQVMEMRQRKKLKESPQERGRKRVHFRIECVNFRLIEKRSPRKGTKTELSFAQMSPYVSREDPREGDETYLTWQDSGDRDPLMEPGV